MSIKEAVKIDEIMQVITIFGVRYSFEFFQHFGEDQIGTTLKIVRREKDGVIECVKVDNS